MEVCQVKSKAVNPSLITDLIGCQQNQKEQNIGCQKNQKQKKVFQKIDKQHSLRKNRKLASQNLYKTNSCGYTLSNHKRAIKSKPRKTSKCTNKTVIAIGNNNIKK